MRRNSTPATRIRRAVVAARLLELARRKIEKAEREYERAAENLLTYEHTEVSAILGVELRRTAVNLDRFNPNMTALGDSARARRNPAIRH